MSLSQKAKKSTNVDLDVRRLYEEEAHFCFFFLFLVGDVWLFNHNGSPILVCNWLKLFHIINQIDKNKKKAWIVWKKGMYIAIGFGEGRWCRIRQKKREKSKLVFNQNVVPICSCCSLCLFHSIHTSVSTEVH